MRNFLSAALAILPLAGFAAPWDLHAEDVGIRAPEGFEVSLYAGDDLAHDIYSMTIDSHGRVVVAGRGYVKILHDTDDDGRADKATLFSEFPKSGAHGMVFLGNDLIATGDNLLMRLSDKDADGVADGKPIPLANVQSSEHGANGLVQGPDGWIYMICGNDAGAGAQFARTKTSPVKKPQAGAVVRFSPDFKTSEVFAHGFRNPYDLAFNENGHLFTVDADGERDQYLPWYAPTRLFDIQQGMHHGWVQRGWTRSWNRPEYFFDNVERLVEIGRGSPTGVECYRHYAFPSHYRGGIYSCCWTLGTVYYFPLQRDGASYKSRKEIFLQTTGDVGFAPTDIAVGPDGEMYVSIGGRGTRGSVFCVRYVGQLKEAEKALVSEGEMEDVLNAPQPLAAWSRKTWMPLAEKLGELEFASVAGSRKRSTEQRIRALEILREQFGGLSLLMDRDLYVWPNQRVSSRAIWALEPVKGDEAAELEREVFLTFRNASFRDYGLGQEDDRAFWESIAMRPGALHDSVLLLGFQAESPRNQAARLLAMNAMDVQQIPNRMEEHMRRGFQNTVGPEDFAPIMNLARRYRPEESPVQADRVEQADDADDEQELPPEPFRDGYVPPTLRRDIDRPLSLHELYRRHDPSASDEEVETNDVENEPDEAIPAVPTRPAIVQARLNAVRLLQLALGDVRVEPTRPDVYAGYAANAPEKVATEHRRKAAEVLGQAFPTDDRATNLEIARLIGMLEIEDPAVTEFAEKICGCWRLGSSLQDDIHFLIVLSRLPGERTTQMTEATADALAALHLKLLINHAYPSRNWPRRVGEMFVELCKRDPKLAKTLATHRDFGLPAHAMFAELMPIEQRHAAARRLLQRADRNDEVQWTPAMITLVAELEDTEAIDAVRGQWDNYALRDAIVESLHRNPQVVDHPLFIEALGETNSRTVGRAADALAELDKPGSPTHIAAVLASLRHHGSIETAGDTRKSLGKAFNTMSGQEFQFNEADGKDPLATYSSAFDWFAKEHPQENERLSRSGEINAAQWDQRLAKIDWAKGEAASGEKIYESRSCSKCHAGNNRLGPGLEGVTSRWSRTDLLKEIVDPNRNVMPQFMTSRLETSEGKVYHGVPVYASPDGTLLQTGPNETIRIAGPEVVSITKSRTSLMPTGLLRDLGDEDIANLYAYLKTLTAKP